MKVSAKGRSRIRAYEAYREFAYPDPGSPLYQAAPNKPWGRKPAREILTTLSEKTQSLSGKPWTVGYGETLNVDMDDRRTETEALAEFNTSLVKYERAVTESITEASQNQFDAMVSLCYNIGIAGFKKSSVLKAHNRGDFQAAARAFGLWNKSNGKVLDGLVQRRMKEAATYLEDDFSDPQPITSSKVDPESNLARSPIIGGSTITAGAGTVAVVAETSQSVRSIRESLGDWLPYVLVAVAVAGAAYVIWYRVKQRRDGWN